MARKDIFDLYHIETNNINCCDINGWTALHHASSKGCLEDVLYLLHSGADANVKNLKGETSLMLAAEREHTAIVQLLIRHKTPPVFDCDHERSWTILHHTSYAGLDLEIVQSLMRHRNPLINSKTSSGKTALMLAAENSPKHVVEWLIHSGADIDCIDDKGWTALHYASSKGRIEMVLCLARLGADISVRNSKGETPARLAHIHRHIIIVKLLNSCKGCLHGLDEKQRLNTMLFLASYDGLATLVQLLVNEGADIENKRNYFGETALLVAAGHSHKDVVESLINLGADINICNDRGLTALHYAARAGCTEIVQYLVTKGADLELRCHAGKTPLIRAVEDSHKNVVELLANLGANIKVCGDNGWTLLHYAASTKKVDTVRFLVSKGVDFDSVSRHGDTPLLIAAEASNLEVVEILLESSANIGRYPQCKALLHYASRNGWIAIVQSLVKIGVNLNCRMSDLSTPLISALSMDKFETARYLLEEGANCNIRNISGESALNVLLQRSKVRDLETMKTLIEHGAYVNSCANHILMSKLLMQVYILKNIKLCSKVIINNFNNKDLPAFYNVFASANRLPVIEKLKLINGGAMALQVQQDVARDIRVRGYCNVLAVRSLVLRILAIQSLLKYVPTTRR